MRSYPFLALLGLLAVSTASGAGAPAMGDAVAARFIRQLEAAGRPASEMVAGLIEDGRSVRDATALTVAAASAPSLKAAATLFGMCIAIDRNETEEAVGAAALAASGAGDSDVARVVSGFSEQQCEALYTLRSGTLMEPLRPQDPGPPLSPSN
jgi:hypothetical protein